MHPLIIRLKHLAPVSPGLEDHLLSIIEKKICKKDEIVRTAAEIPSCILFVEKGLLREYSTMNGVEVSQRFAWEENILLSPQGSPPENTSSTAVAALENSLCWYISAKDSDEACRLYPAFINHLRLLLTEQFHKEQQWSIAVKSQKNHKKYKALMELESQLALRVPNKYISSYLEMSDSAYTAVRRAYGGKR